MLLRKYLTSGRLEEVRAERGERLVYFVFGCTNEMGDPVRITLAAELMGRYANIVVIGGEGRIIDCLRRVDADLSAQRQVLPGLYYQPPAAVGRLPDTLYFPLLAVTSLAVILLLCLLLRRHRGEE